MKKLNNFEKFQNVEKSEKINEIAGLPLKVSMIMMSHLSDISDAYGILSAAEARQRINFVKFLIMKYKDTNVEIDADAEWTEFVNKFPHLQA